MTDKLKPSDPTNEVKPAPLQLLPDLRPRYGWMDSVDFDYELGNALGGNVIYPSEENLRDNRGCIDTDGHCTATRVVVFCLESPRLMWQGDPEKVWPCGHGKWDSRYDCLTCQQQAVKTLNAEIAKLRIDATSAPVSPPSPRENVEAIDFYNAHATNIVNVPRVNHDEDPSGWAGVRRAREAGIFAKDALVMSLADACDFAEKYAATKKGK
jgi:hypothetical protein